MKYDYKPIDEALKTLLEYSRLDIGYVETDLIDAIGMVLAEDIYAPIDLPPFDRSAVDGYAVCSDATTSASPSNPIPLKVVVGEALASCDEAIPVATGQRIPKGADAVVMLEDVIRKDNGIYVIKSLPKYANVSRKGEDVKAGEKIASKGEIIKPIHLALFSALGITKLRIFKHVHVGVAATGSEIAEPAYGVRAYDEGLILDSTSILIRSTLSKYRFIKVNWYGFVKDDENEIANIAKMALDENNILILTGGTGPSEQDKTFRAILSIDSNAKVIARGLAMRPGRPTSIVVVKSKPVFLLSGFPVAAYIALNVVVLNFLFRALNIKEELFIEVPAQMTKRISGSIGYDSFIRVKVFKCDEDLCTEPIMIHGSGVLKSLLHSNALLVIPKNVEGFDKGDRVWVKML
ncbi:molybdopterin molybdotransferase MoeA [Ignisphaera sp. 4213-co]|uniref:Molybdopterin molybdotransferase MoeA n=1 Tax=Ignisphaera cupida TaxID=3050454 RepID=A0ABD4Z6X5_9CREN|nr:molybdopterin molybdotransferase MoeA [Ignisphaera sp. 4213-co]MDK6029086.1 molybdopterin molybdotransferase MoeA [Ignisphaera sp. 4213-co]